MSACATPQRRVLPKSIYTPGATIARQRRELGEAGVNGGPSGDLYVQVHIKPHSVFQRDHDDLHCEMPISFATATFTPDHPIDV